MGNKSMSYRPDIDGLRAVAVVAVVSCHAGIGFSGGYVGVDVFFVISGFLITGRILKENRTHKSTKGVLTGDPRPCIRPTND